MGAELLGSGLISNEEVNGMIIAKADEYLLSAKCRKMKSNPIGGLYGEDFLNFGIANGTELQVQHLQAVVAYCDFTEYCTTFSASFRKLQATESIKNVNARNSRFYFCSRFLREAVMYYGCAGNENAAPNGAQSGPFFTGMSIVMKLPQFTIGFQGPTSTSKKREIAWRFAGPNGMVIELKNKEGSSAFEPLWNASWLSAFPEEDERIWCGSIFSLQVCTVVIVKGARDYKKSIAAFYKFDALVSGEFIEGMEMSPKEAALVASCINADSFGSVSKMDAYIIDNFYAFVHHKKRIRLILSEIAECVESALDLVQLFMHSMREQGQDAVSDDDNTNLFKPLLLELFTNVQDHTGEHMRLCHQFPVVAAPVEGDCIGAGVEEHYCGGRRVHLGTAGAVCRGRV